MMIYINSCEFFIWGIIIFWSSCKPTSNKVSIRPKIPTTSQNRRKRTQAILKYFRKNFGIILKPNWKNSWKIWFVLVLNDLSLKPLTKWNFWKIISEILILKLYAITYWISLRIPMLERFNKWSTDSLHYWIYLQCRLEYRCIYSWVKRIIKYIQDKMRYWYMSVISYQPDIITKIFSGTKFYT